MFLPFVWFDTVGNLESMKPVHVVVKYQLILAFWGLCPVFVTVLCLVPF